MTLRREGTTRRASAGAAARAVASLAAIAVVGCLPAARSRAQEPGKAQEEPQAQQQAGQTGGQEQGAAQPQPPSPPQPAFFAGNDASLALQYATLKLTGRRLPANLAALGTARPKDVAAALAPFGLAADYHPNVSAAQAQALMSRKGGVFPRLFSHCTGTPRTATTPASRCPPSAATW